jgi:hypothetical protein
VAFYALFIGEPLRSDAPDAPVMGITSLMARSARRAKGCGTVRTVDEIRNPPSTARSAARCHAEAVVECERA